MTLREHLEAIRDTAKDCDDIQNTAELHFLCAVIVDDAVAALAILDEAERLIAWHAMPDDTPTNGSLCLIPDPLSSGSSVPDAPRATKETT